MGLWFFFCDFMVLWVTEIKWFRRGCAFRT